jgi:hypothetical protein
MFKLIAASLILAFAFSFAASDPGDAQPQRTGTITAAVK